MPAEHQDGKGCKVGDERDDGNHGGENTQDLQPHILCIGISGEEFFVLGLLCIQNADEGGAQNAFVDDLVEPVDDLLRALEERAHAGEQHKERGTDDGNDDQHGQGKLPLQEQQQHAGTDIPRRLCRAGYLDDVYPAATVDRC